ncbi:MAG: hypothetical protein M3Y21_04845 [Candidatus Eremiobacteraeota bacterium]|nr:hypothetical protein [Candidatus Eremiobacteraeota bacterium]
MIKGLRVFTGCVVCVALLGAVAPVPLRHLVYNFDVTVRSTTSVHSSGIGTTGSGVSDYTGGVGDKGTIVADVMAATADKGLVVDVSEQARNDRSATVVRCAVYGDGRVFCDPSRKVNDEEMAALRYLGRSFVDPTALDANNHWRIANASPALDISADYTVKSNTNGILNIDFQRVLAVKGAQASNTTTDGSLVYNLTDDVPSQITEDTMERSGSAMSGDSTIHTQIHLTLASDSMQARKQAGVSH